MDLPQNTFKRRLQQGESQIGLWVTIPDPAVVEAIAGAGFDWIVLDTEHTPVEVSSVLGLLQAASAYPTACIVRPYVNDTALIKRHLDQGAMTLLIPFVQSRAEAEAAVAAIHYPPLGVRGVAGTHRGGRFGRIKDYTVRANAEICLIVQVETQAALDRMEDIAGVDGVDAIFIGPADLAASMGFPGQPGHPKVKAAILDAFARLGAMGKPGGILTLDAGFARECIAAGATFTAVGTDFSTLIGGVDRLAREFNAGFVPK